jgi:hypothetical protein
MQIILVLYVLNIWLIRSENPGKERAGRDRLRRDRVLSDAVAPDQMVLATNLIFSSLCSYTQRLCVYNCKAN